jgi:hypothetical protein
MHRRRFLQVAGGVAAGYSLKALAGAAEQY